MELGVFGHWIFYCRSRTRVLCFRRSNAVDIQIQNRNLIAIISAFVIHGQVQNRVPHSGVCGFVERLHE